jgi:hypothetical protein
VAADDLICPDCGRPLIDGGPGGIEPGQWVCPIAMRAMRLGILGEEGRKHKEVWTYSMGYVMKAEGNKRDRAEEPGDVVVSLDLRSVYLCVDNRTPKEVLAKAPVSTSRRRCKDPEIVRKIVKRVRAWLEEGKKIAAERKAAEAKLTEPRSVLTPDEVKVICRG